MRPPPIRKSLGQHFLTDPRILARIADAVALGPDETVVEIGPGRGSLTDALLARAARVVAIEIDRKLVELLREKYAHEPRLTIIEADVLDVNLGEAAGGAYALAGNVPYYITTPILFQALQQPRALRSVLLVQREVAARMAAEPGAEDYGALSVNVQAVARRGDAVSHSGGRVHTAAARGQRCGARDTARGSRSEAGRGRAVPNVRAGRFRAQAQANAACGAHDCERRARTMRSALLRRAAIDPDARPETLSARNSMPWGARSHFGAERYSRFESANDSRSSSIRHVHGVERDVRGNVQLNRRKAHDAHNSRRHHLVHHALRRGCRNRDHRDVHRALAIVLGERFDRAHREIVDLAPDLRRIRVVEPDHPKAALLKSLVLRERGADLSDADDDHAPVALEPQNAPHALRELGHLIAEPALSERAEKGEILSHLRGGRAASRRQLFAGDGRESRVLEFLEKSQVQGQSANGGIGDPLQGHEWLVNSFTR